MGWWPDKMPKVLINDQSQIDIRRSIISHPQGTYAGACLAPPGVMACVDLCFGLLCSAHLAASGDCFRPSSGSGHEMLSDLTGDTPRGSINPVIEIPWSSLGVPELPDGGTWRGERYLIHRQVPRDHGRCNALPCLPTRTQLHVSLLVPANERPHRYRTIPRQQSQSHPLRPATRSVGLCACKDWNAIFKKKGRNAKQLP